MKRSLPSAALVVSGALSAAGMALADTSDAEELKMFSKAQVDIQQALLIAMDGTDGKVSSIEFESEDAKPPRPISRRLPAIVLRRIQVRPPFGQSAGEVQKRHRPQKSQFAPFRGAAIASRRVPKVPWQGAANPHTPLSTRPYLRHSSPHDTTVFVKKAP